MPVEVLNWLEKMPKNNFDTLTGKKLFFSFFVKNGIFKMSSVYFDKSKRNFFKTSLQATWKSENRSQLKSEGVNISSWRVHAEKKMI